MDLEKLKEVMQDEDFVKEILSRENPEEVQKLLEDKGISMSTAEIRQTAEIIEKVSSGEMTKEDLENRANGELSDDDLEEVAGGIAPFIVGLAVLAGANGVVGGLAGALGVKVIADSFRRVFRRW